MDWQQQVLDELESAQAQVTALMVNADTGEAMINLDMEKPVVSASTIKVAIMLHALQRVEQGTLTLEQQLFIREKEILPDTTVFEYGAQSMSVGELIRWMIIESDNTATNALILKAGIAFAGMSVWSWAPGQAFVFRPCSLVLAVFAGAMLLKKRLSVMATIFLCAAAGALCWGGLIG